jgi:hypothetical protein
MGEAADLSFVGKDQYQTYKDPPNFEITWSIMM